ncbi:RNA 2',3'-cyclic phosphodiesterase [Actinomadura flavalba]|uniref:RNA 2',3'-cyclic phosphodiesterase n=1 Tax=Actinomadura flavalba TaxID=1120938 RepID=UPI00036C8102|nr:RNA 2',3'-cyclic phosphodiesterase [Actinomadura flavalba]
MRLFVALLPPPEVLDGLDAFIDPFRAAWPGLRWVRRDLLHVTLTFLGDVDDLTFDRLLPRLERAIARHDRMRLALVGGGAFPLGGQHARVVWTGVYGDRRALAGLAAATNAAGRRAGLPIDTHRMYRPHVTLARTRSPIDVRRLLEPLTTFASAPWHADAVTLVRSHPPTEAHAQPDYETLKTWSLR